MVLANLLLYSAITPFRVGASPQATAVLVVGTRTYELQLATTPAQQQRGLSGRARMAPDAGMLFVYRSSGDRCFWMKGMRFSLDIMWLSALDKVVSLQPDVSPKDSMVYCTVSQDVLELKGGQVVLAGIKLGRVLNLEMPTRRVAG